MQQGTIEARLLTQATVLYTKGMRYLEMADFRVEKIQEADVFEVDGLIEAHNNQLKFAIKLLRLHNETVETLSKLRGGNDQKITVQYVHVNDGGKAMVGNFQAGGGDDRKISAAHE